MKARPVQRITITIEDELLDRLDAHMERSGASNRSEAIRDILWRGLASRAPGDAQCLAIVSYAVEPDLRDLGRRLPQGRQAQHDSTIAALSVPVDHDHAVEVVVLRGRARDVSNYAHGLFAERGVTHGNLTLLPVDHAVEFHDHGHGEPHSHSHLRIRKSFDPG